MQHNISFIMDPKEFASFAKYAREHFDNTDIGILKDDGRKALLDKEYPDIYQYFETQSEVFWLPASIDLTNDSKLLDELNDDEALLLKKTLSFFANIDSFINDNVLEVILDMVKVIECKMYFQLQMTIELTHQVTYTNLIEAIIPDRLEQEEMCDSFQYSSAISAKRDWIAQLLSIRNDSGQTPFAILIFCMIMMEGLQLMVGFVSVQYLLNKRNTYGLATANAYISRDEHIHLKCAALIYRKYINGQMSQEWFERLLDIMVQLEKKFAAEVMPKPLSITMTREMLDDFIEYQADVVLQTCGYARKYKKENPFTFMQHLEVSSKTNFFETRGTEYSQPIEKIASDDLFDEID